MVNEDALEGLTAGRTAGAWEGPQGDQGRSWSPVTRTTWLKVPHSPPGPAAWFQILVLPHSGSEPQFSPP